MTKNLLGLLFWSAVTLCALGVTVAVVTSNYLALAYSFYLQRYDGQPLSEETFIGPLFQAVAPEATLAQLYSLGIALAIAGGFFLLFNKLFNSFDSYQALKAHRAEGNSEQANAFKVDLHEKLLCATLLLIALIPVISWDISLFRFRGAASVNKLDSPDGAVDLITWDKLLEEPSFALELTRLGSWSYIAMTASLCLGLEITARKTRRYADRCFTTIEDLGVRAGQPVERPLLGYDAEGHAVYDSTIALAYDAEGNSIAGPQSSHESNSPSAPAATEPKQAAEPLFVVPPVGPTSRDDQESASGAAPAETQKVEVQPRTAARTAASEELRTVIGTEERVSMQDAARDPERYYVDMTNGVVWDRACYEALHGVDSMPSEQAA